MATRNNDAPPADVTEAEFTTNDEDQREVARLEARLRDQKNSKRIISATRGCSVPFVKIADGAHKYVLISAQDSFSGEEHYFVTSKRGAHYHRDAAEAFIAELEEGGFCDIRVTGGGRIRLDRDKKMISIFGYSYGFGLADHSISRNVVLEDARYKDFNVTISNDGY